MVNKTKQLGVPIGTASYRLVKDLLFNLVENKTCFRCGEELTRDTFSIDHKEPWLNTENPIEAFYNLGNITYSHKVCNSKAHRSLHQKYFTSEEKREAKRLASQKARDKRRV